MDKNTTDELFDNWLNRSQDKIPLLRTEEDNLTPILRDGLLQRSDALTKKLSAIKQQASSDYGQPACTEGICYLIYRNENKKCDPLYVGISETIGKKGKLSALFKYGWVRFGEGIESNGHIGNMNEALQGSNRRYDTWISNFFATTKPLKLRTPIFVRIEIWKSDSVSIFKELGHTPLKLEEMLRLHVLQLAGYTTALLNRDGNRHMND